MEYEIIDAIRIHDCTILYGKTEAGRPPNTQVPQFFYEDGFSHDKKSNNSGHLLTGLTQPRHVAAISTATRVSQEMGFGNSQSIPPNNLVAYQIQYETVGLSGGRGFSTFVKFMTDGISLQEIQSDLL